eukprot:5926696-Pyramimonas_sp.AAC.1
MRSHSGEAPEPQDGEGMRRMASWTSIKVRTQVAETQEGVDTRNGCEVESRHKGQVHEVRGQQKKYTRHYYEHPHEGGDAP